MDKHSMLLHVLLMPYSVINYVSTLKYILRGVDVIKRDFSERRKINLYLKKRMFVKIKYLKNKQTWQFISNMIDFKGILA